MWTERVSNYPGRMVVNTGQSKSRMIIILTHVLRMLDEVSELQINYKSGAKEVWTNEEGENVTEKEQIIHSLLIRLSAAHYHEDSATVKDLESQIKDRAMDRVTIERYDSTLGDA